MYIYTTIQKQCRIVARVYPCESFILFFSIQHHRA